MNELLKWYLDRVRAIVRSGGASSLVLRTIWEMQWSTQLFIRSKSCRMRTLYGYSLKNWIDNKGNKELLKKARTNPRRHCSSEPLVSVIIPTYNRARVLCERTIPSVLKQTYRNFELIVIGDHCTDNTWELIERFHDKRIRFFNLDKRGEYPRDPYYRWMVAGIVPVNKGLELAKGEWIAHLDDDDEFSEDHLQVLLEHALENHYELVYGIIEMEITPGKWAHVGSYPPKLAHICRLSALYDSKLRFFKYDIKAWKYEEPGDWNLWRRMKEAGVKIGFVDRVVGRHYLEGRARALLAHKSPRKFGSLLRIPLQLQRRIARYPKFMNVEDYEKWYYSRPEARRYSGDERIWVNLSDMIQYFRPKRVFEFGSGLGNILQECGKRGIDAVGSETSRYAIQNNLCKEKLVKIGEIPKSRLPFRDCSFDLVFSSEVMEHVKEEHTEAIINELNRICSGYALLTINTFDYKQPGHQNMHSRNWWLARFEKCGFERDDKAWSDIDKTKYLQWDIYIFRKINARAR